MRGLDVRLDPADLDLAVRVGMRRLMESGAQRLDAAKSLQRPWVERVRDETVGCLGELAVAKAKGLTWSESVNTFKNVPDVGALEVRATWRLDGRLVIREWEPVDPWYVFVVGGGPVMTIVGSIRGRDARRDEWIANPRNGTPAWFVPQSALRWASAPRLRAVS